MNKFAKRIVSIVLSAVMVLSLGVTPVWAGANNSLSYTLDISNDTVTNEADKTVTIDINLDSAVMASGIEYVVTCPTGLEITGVAAGDGSNCNIASGDVNMISAQEYKVVWTEGNMDNVSIANIGVITVKIPAGTTAGDYPIDITGIKVAADYGFTALANGDETSATITVEAPAAQGYTAGLNTTTPTVTVGGTATVNVGVSHSSDSAFNAAELVLEYDSSFLTVTNVANSISATDELNYEDDAANGVLTIQDFGADKSFSTSNYVITFTTKGVTAANSPATATVELISAKFIDKVGATTNDLIDATLSTASVNITITEETFNVTLPTDGVITGATEAVKGADYTFSVEDYDNYDYDITVTVGGNEIDTVVDNGNGTYTIPGASVIDDIVITYTRNANTYLVTWEGTGAADVITKPTQATYGTSFTFTLPANIPAQGLVSGWEYAATVTIGSTTYSCSVDGLNYTIAGDAITDAIVITVTKTEVANNSYTVTLDGTGAGDATVTATPVVENDEASITLTREDGYTYTVTATMGGQAVSALIGGNTYTVADVTGNVVFTVTKTLNTFNTNVYDYVNGMKLVTFAPTLASGKVPTYSGNVMFYSAKYQAYCYLVLAQDLSVADAQAQLGAVTGTATDVNYGMNINGSAHIDAADAQLVWNMYNAQYTDFTSGVTMAQFLAADQNAVSTDATATYGLSVQDALVIIEALLAGTAQ